MKIGNFKGLFIFLLLLLTSLLMVACNNTEEKDEVKKRKELTVLYTNDVHAQVMPVKATWKKDEPMMGGFANIASYINKVESQEENVVYLDAGDMITGPPISTLTEGEAIIDLYNYLDVDASVYGNHEFDHGSKNAKDLADQAKFPILAANIFYKNGESFGKPYKIINTNDIKIGVIGILGKRAAKETIFKDNIKNITFKKRIPIIQKYVNEIKSKVDVVIVLGHEGKAAEQGKKIETVNVKEKFAADVKVANNVEGIDVLISGHAHLPIREPYIAKETGTILVSTRGLGTQVGYLNLKIDPVDNKIVDHKGHLEPIYTDKIKPDPKLAGRVDYWKNKLDKITREIIGSTPKLLTRTYNDDSVLGKLSADAMRQATQSDIAFQHPGGLRADIAKGDITVGDVISVLPFPNDIYTMKLKGKHLLQVLEQIAAMNYGVLSPSGVTMTIDLSQPKGNRVVKAKHNGKEIDLEKTYTVAVDAFIAMGGDDFTGFLKGKMVKSAELTASDALIKHIKELGKVNLENEDRVIKK